MDMFDMFGMMGNYESRKIENTKVNDAIIDTCKVTDSKAGHETGISHPHYNDGKWIIVAEYFSVDKAREGHKKWVKIFEKGLPEELKDVSTCSVVELSKTFGFESDITHKKRKKYE